MCRDVWEGEKEDQGDKEVEGAQGAGIDSRHGAEKKEYILGQRVSRI